MLGRDQAASEVRMTGRLSFRCAALAHGIPQGAGGTPGGVRSVEAVPSPSLVPVFSGKE